MENILRNVSKDYYENKLSDDEIAIKHKIRKKSVTVIAHRYPFESVVEQKQKMIIKVDPEDYELSIAILKTQGIETQEVTKQFELLEYYESSIK